MPTTQLRSLLALWLAGAEVEESQIVEVEGGLSDARVWRVTLGGQVLCLRRWPAEHRPLPTLVAVHGLIEHVHHRRVDIVPLPRHTRVGNTLVFDQDHLWELASWLPGTAVPAAEVTPHVLTEAARALARFHLAAADFTTADHMPSQGPAAGLLTRQSLLSELQDGYLESLREHVSSQRQHPHYQVAGEMLRTIESSLPRVLQMVKVASEKVYRLQWCLRDVHREHLLFANGEVTGLVDFGAAAVDSVACDLARLSGSMSSSSAPAWRIFLASYEQHRPLSPAERQAIAAFDAGGLVGAAANWIRWLFVEHRTFGNRPAIDAKLAELQSRLRFLASNGGASVAAACWEDDKHPLGWINPKGQGEK